MIDEKRLIIIVRMYCSFTSNVKSVPTMIIDKKALITLHAIVIKNKVLILSMIT